MMGGHKEDKTKLRTDLVPVGAIMRLAEVLQYGAGRYGDLNWREGMRWSRVYAALLRHLFAFWNGEHTDPESGLCHLDHVVCNAVFLSEYAAGDYGEFDDRRFYRQTLSSNKS
jgi:hypothetical protein